MLALSRRAWSLAIGFPGFHALNMVLGILYTLVQTLIFARVLPPELFSQTIAATAVSIYILPLNQAVARAAFVVLRQRRVAHSVAGGSPETTAAFYGTQFLSIAVSLVTPPLLGAADWPTYTALACYLFLCCHTNVWVTEMQMTMLAIDRPMRFEYVNTTRRLLIFATLGWLMLSRDFLMFTILAAVQTAAYHVWGLFRLSGGDEQLFGWPRGLRRAEVMAHGRLLWVSLQATGAEWVAYNAPYAAFTIRFGIGPELVAIDAVLKLVRVVVSIVRNLSEIVLPRVSRALLTGDRRRAAVAVSLVLLASGGGALVLAAIVLVDEHWAFTFLLGPNNTVPAGAGAPAAVAILSSSAFATAAHLIGHTGNIRSIRTFLIAPVIGAALLLLVMLGLGATSLESLWAFALTLTLVSVVSVGILFRLLVKGPAR